MRYTATHVAYQLMHGWRLGGISRNHEQLLLDGSRFMRDSPHYVLEPVILLALMMASLNFLSDVLSKRLDPVRRRGG